MTTTYGRERDQDWPLSVLRASFDAVPGQFENGARRSEQTGSEQRHQYSNSCDVLIRSATQKRQVHAVSPSGIERQPEAGAPMES